MPSEELMYINNAFLIEYDTWEKGGKLTAPKLCCKTKIGIDVASRRVPVTRALANTACAEPESDSVQSNQQMDVEIDFDTLTGGSAAHHTSASTFFSSATDRPVLTHMLSFLDPKSLAAVCEANHPHLSPLASSNELWRPAYARDFGPALQDDANYKRLYLDSVDARQRLCVLLF
jgi:hypothetical protein